MKRLVLFGCLSVLFVSCGKRFLEPDGGGVVVPPDPVLKKIMQGGKLDTEYDYNSSGQFVKSTTYYSSGSIHFERVLRYDNAGLITKIETSRETTGSSTPKYEQAYSELVYSSQKLTEFKNYRIDNGTAIYTGRSVPEYNSDGRTTAVIEYDANGQLKGKTTYDYHEGNVVRLYNYLGSSSTPSSDIGYEFDNLKNPLKGISTFPFSSNVNNVTKTVTGTHLIATYTYNSRGYPITKTENGINYEYIYQ
jgi:hypothetical protein